MLIDWSQISYSPSSQSWLLRLPEEELQRLWGEPAPEARFFSRLKPRKAKLVYAPPLEIEIAGSPERCETAHFPVVEKVVLHLRDLAQEVEEYLKGWINLTHLKDRKGQISTGDTCVQSVGFGTWKDAEVGEFEVCP